MEMKPRVILFPLPLQGHINPMMQLANVLLSRGFSISVLQTDFNSLSPSAYPDFTFHSIPFDPLETGSPSPAADAFAFMRNLNVSCRVQFRECLARILSDPSMGRVACLVTTAPLYFTQAVADEFGLRRLVLQTSSICAYLALSTLPLLREKGYIPLQESRVEEPIPELPPCKFKDMHQLVKRMNSEDIFSVVTSVDRSVEASSGVIWNTFEDLERDRMAEFSREFGGVPVFPIGPFHKNFPASSSSLLEADRSSIAWLDEQATNSVLYVSFGSLVQQTALPVGRARQRVGAAQPVARWVPGSSRGQRASGQVGAAAGGPGSSGDGQVLHPRGLELDPGEHMRGGPDDLPAVHRGPVGEHEVRERRVEGRDPLGGSDRQGRDREGHQEADGERRRGRDETKD